MLHVRIEAQFINADNSFQISGRGLSLQHVFARSVNERSMRLQNIRFNSQFPQHCNRCTRSTYLTRSLLCRGLRLTPSGCAEGNIMTRPKVHTACTFSVAEPQEKSVADLTDWHTRLATTCSRCKTNIFQVPQWSKMSTIHESSGVMKSALLSMEREVHQFNCPKHWSNKS